MHPPPIDTYKSDLEARARLFIEQVSHPLKFRLFMLMNLPMAFIAGLRVMHFDFKSAVISVPYNGVNKNPFRSTYFAVLSMAAEMSTGLLAMMLVKDARPAISMLVTGVEGAFIKKAVGTTFFECRDGMALADAVEQCIISGRGITLRTLSIGTNEGGEEVARFYITWSFRVKG